MCKRIYRRQNSIDAFSLFLKRIEFYQKQDLHELFSCKTCVVDAENGEMQIDGVVMDGLAMRILGTLPDFIRHMKVVSCVPRASEK